MICTWIKKVNIKTISLQAGLAATLIGMATFLLNWNFYDFWGGPIPGYQIFLFPGNMSLIYVWHPLFTEELGFYKKLGLMLLGQFVFVSSLAVVVFSIAKNSCRTKNR